MAGLRPSRLTPGSGETGPPSDSTAPSDEVVPEAVPQSVIGNRLVNSLRARLQGPARVWLLTAANATIGSGLYIWIVVRWDGISQTRIPIALLLVALFASAEVFVVHFEFRRDSHTFSLVEVPLVLGLLFAQPALIAPAHVFGAGLALVLYRKQSLTKLLFNLAAFALEDAVAVIIFYRLGGPVDFRAVTTSAVALAAAVVASVIGMVAVFAAIELSGGRLTATERRQALGFGLLATTMTTSVTMIVAILAEVDRATAWIPLVPAGGIYLAHRIYVSERNERRRLEFLHQSTGLLNESHDIDWAVNSLLNQARTTFGADIAALNYLPAGDLQSLALTVVGPGDEHQSSTSVPRARLLDAWARTAGSDGQMMTDLRDDIEILIPGVAIRNALVIPVRGEAQVIGYMLVANRLSTVGRFSQDDLRVFQTLGHHVSVALENGQLEQSLQDIRVLERQLAFRATHDPLTGLANRMLVQDELTSRLASVTEPAGIAVIVIEVTAVTTVNRAGASAQLEDCHAAVADKLRMVVAQRLRRCLRDHDLVARLGADSFCVVLDTPGGEVVSAAVAERLKSVLNARITIDTATIPSDVRVGVAVNYADDDAETLLARAQSPLERIRRETNGGVDVRAAEPERVSPVKS